MNDNTISNLQALTAIKYSSDLFDYLQYVPQQVRDQIEESGVFQIEYCEVKSSSNYLIKLAPLQGSTVPQLVNLQGYCHEGDKWLLNAQVELTLGRLSDPIFASGSNLMETVISLYSQYDKYKQVTKEIFNFLN